jgi:hypothetical protein
MSRDRALTDDYRLSGTIDDELQVHDRPAPQKTEPENDHPAASLFDGDDVFCKPHPTQRNYPSRRNDYTVSALTTERDGN